MLVREIASDLTRRRRGHERFRDASLAHRRLGPRDIGLHGWPILPRHRSRARRPALKRRRELAEQLRKLREFRLAGAAGRRERTLEAGQPVDDMDGIIGAALLAVVDDVDAGSLLLLDHAGDRLGDRSLERSVMGAGLLHVLQQQVHHLPRPRQAAGVGGENSLGAAPHCRFPRGGHLSKRADRPLDTLGPRGQNPTAHSTSRVRTRQTSNRLGRRS